MPDRLEYWLNPKAAYNEQHDAWYWKETGEWIEGQCKDPNCEFCKDRPEKVPHD